MLYTGGFTDNVQDHSKEVLLRLEKIDDNADKLGIAFVKINDLELVDEYGLTGLPSLVYYRHAAPIIYEGKMHVLNHTRSISTLLMVTQET